MTHQAFLKKGAACALAAIVTLASALPAEADYVTYPYTGEDPDFTSSVVTSRGISARSEAEWEALEDDLLEWDEIDDLIHEYNAQVVEGRSELSSDERRSMDAAEVSEFLLSKAEDYEDDALEYEDTSATLAATYRASAASLRQQAAANLDDFDIIKLNYELIEKNLRLSAKTDFIEYHRGMARDEFNAVSIAYLENQLSSVRRLYDVQMATELELLSAEEALYEAQASSVSEAQDTKSYYRSLIVLCGWNYQSEASIGDLPAVDVDQVKAMDFDEGLDIAKDTSITLKIDRIRIKNAGLFGSSQDVSSENTGLTNDTDTLSIGLRAAYDSMQNSARSYENALSALSSSEREYEKALREYELGVLSESALRDERYDLDSCSFAAESAYLDLLLVQTTYEAYVSDGIA